MPPKKPVKRPAGIDKKKKPLDDPDTCRKSRVGFKNAHQLSQCLAPFIDKRFFTSYTTDRAIKSIDKKKLCSSFSGNYNQ